MIIRGPKDKKRILDNYEERYSSPGSTAPIMARQKGKTQEGELFPFVPCTTMRPEPTKYYRVEDLNLYPLVTIVLRECHESFDSQDLLDLAAINKDFVEMIPIVIRSFDMDFTKRREPRLNYENQGKVN